MRVTAAAPGGSISPVEEDASDKQTNKQTEATTLILLNSNSVPSPLSTQNNLSLSLFLFIFLFASLFLLARALEEDLPMTQPTHNNEKPLKIVVLGECSVGKSALTFRYVEQCFSGTPLPATVAVEFRPCTVVLDDGQVVPLEVWDTAGQERYRGVVTIFYRGADVVLLCFDLSNRSSFECLEEIVGRIEKFAPPGVPMVLVGCKSDLKESGNNAVQTAEAEGWAAARGVNYIETSAKDNTNVAEAFRMAAAQGLSRRSAMREAEAEGDGQHPARVSLHQGRSSSVVLVERLEHHDEEAQTTDTRAPLLPRGAIQRWAPRMEALCTPIGAIRRKKANENNSNASKESGSKRITTSTRSDIRKLEPTRLCMRNSTKRALRRARLKKQSDAEPVSISLGIGEAAGATDRLLSWGFPVGLSGERGPNNSSSKEKPQ
eukprot:gene9567-6722_t